jgi:hypothetical protein
VAWLERVFELCEISAPEVRLGVKDDAREPCLFGHPRGDPPVLDDVPPALIVEPVDVAQVSVHKDEIVRESLEPDRIKALTYSRYLTNVCCDKHDLTVSANPGRRRIWP